MVWEPLSRYGVSVRQVLLHGVDPETALIDACDRTARLLSIGSVQYASGLRMDIERLGEACRKKGILFCVDAIQSVGAVDLNVQDCGADFVMADGHKWMLAPEGLALSYCRAERLDMLRLNQYGWRMREHPLDFDSHEWQAAPSARRFECGSPNMLGIHAQDASISLLQEMGMAAVASQLQQRTQQIVDHILSFPGLRLLSPQPAARRAGIVTFQALDSDLDHLFAHLQQAGIVCAQRGGGLRLSPHFYTKIRDIDRAFEVVRQGLARQSRLSS